MNNSLFGYKGQVTIKYKDACGVEHEECYHNDGTNALLNCLAKAMLGKDITNLKPASIMAQNADNQPRFIQKQSLQATESAVYSATARDDNGDRARLVFRVAGSSLINSGNITKLILYNSNNAELAEVTCNIAPASTSVLLIYWDMIFTK